MFEDNTSTIITSAEQIGYARDNIYNYKKASSSVLHEVKTKILRLGLRNLQNQ